MDIIIIYTSKSSDEFCDALNKFPASGKHSLTVWHGESEDVSEFVDKIKDDFSSVKTKSYGFAPIDDEDLVDFSWAVFDMFAFFNTFPGKVLFVPSSYLPTEKDWDDKCLSVANETGKSWVGVTSAASDEYNSRYLSGPCIFSWSEYLANEPMRGYLNGKRKFFEGRFSYGVNLGSVKFPLAVKDVFFSDGEDLPSIGISVIKKNKRAAKKTVKKTAKKAAKKKAKKTVKKTAKSVVNKKLK